MLTINRWPSELPLKGLIILISILLWALLVLSKIGLFYAAIIALFVYFTRLSLTVHIRGNGVRISELQFPELHHTLTKLSTQAGLPNIPEAYVVESGGVLNAMATRWLGTTMIILNSDLVNACRQKPDMLEFVIGHELGHIAGGHLQATWFLLPGLSFPFLGKAYARAMEFTCDRFAADLVGEKEPALRGLTLLAAGSELGHEVNIEAFIQQRKSLQGLSMTIGRWMSNHPPLCDRVLALLPEHGKVSYQANNIKAVGLILLVAFTPLALMLLAHR